MKRIRKADLIRIALFYKGYYRAGILMALFYLVQNAPVWFSPIFVGKLLDLSVSGDSSRMKHLFLYGGAMISLIILNAPASYFRQRYMSTITRGVSRDLRIAVCVQLQQLSLLYHDSHSVGRIHYKAIRDIEILEQLPNQFIQLIIMTSINLIVALTTIILTKPGTLFFFLFMIPMAVGLNSFFNKKMKITASAYRASFEDMSASLSDMLTMMPVTRAHGVEEFAISEIIRKITGVFHTGFNSDRISNLFDAGSWISFNLFQTLFLLGSVYLCFKGSLSVGEVTMFYAFFGTISGSIMRLMNIYPTLIQSSVAASSISDILDAPDKEMNEGKHRQDSVQGILDFNSVTYQYPGRDEVAVNSINLHIPMGTSVAFVGPSGGGKSTLLHLALGFIRPTSGRILIDGMDMNELDLRGYRSHVGVVGQSVVFFSGTIRENIAYGSPEATEDDIISALELANAWDFVKKLPQGINTRLGEGGIRFSGGQQQRLAIARAIIRNPRILILDEATSALDAESEQLIQQALLTVMRGRTSLIASHRLSLVRQCDEIVVIENGTISAQGTHDTLMARDNFYSRIVNGAE